jgi:hypothetical protein
MPTSGSGTITPIPGGVPGAVPPHPLLSSVVAAAGELRCDDLAVPLPLYAQVISYEECAFFGVIDPNSTISHSNRPLWTKRERDFVAHFLAEAQTEIEDVCKYPLKARWIESERHDFEDPLLLKWRNVIEGGVEGTDFIDEDAPVSYAAEPATVGPITTTVTDSEEVYVYHPDTCARIYPSNIDITGGQLTIEIPRCRLLTAAGQAEGGVDYEDTGAVAGLFEQVVDVVRVYNDDSTEAEFVWPHGSTGCAQCAGTTSDGCITVLNSVIGEVDVKPASYNGSWSSSSWSCFCHYPAYIDVNYRAGLTRLTAQARDAIVRLAHSKMPHDPCNCDPPNWLWTRDKNIPKALTRDRINCPFGLSDGAWIAWQFAESMKIVRGYSL